MDGHVRFRDIVALFRPSPKLIRVALCITALIAILASFFAGNALALGTYKSPVTLWGDISHLIGIAQDPNNGVVCYITDVGAISCVLPGTAPVSAEVSAAAEIAPAQNHAAPATTQPPTDTQFVPTATNRPPATTQPPTDTQFVPTATNRPPATTQPPTATEEPKHSPAGWYHHWDSGNPPKCHDKYWHPFGPPENNPEWKPGACPAP
jgi:hypothetical protein